MSSFFVVSVSIVYSDGMCFNPLYETAANGSLLLWDESGMVLYFSGMCFWKLQMVLSRKWKPLICFHDPKISSSLLFKEVQGGEREAPLHECLYRECMIRMTGISLGENPHVSSGGKQCQLNFGRRNISIWTNVLRPVRSRALSTPIVKWASLYYKSLKAHLGVMCFTEVFISSSWSKSCRNTIEPAAWIVFLRSD